MILDCTCQHEYQSKVYGATKRVHNKTKAMNVFRCTVCGSTKTYGSASTEKQTKVTKK